MYKLLFILFIIKLHARINIFKRIIVLLIKTWFQKVKSVVEVRCKIEESNFKFDNDGT